MNRTLIRHATFAAVIGLSLGACDLDVKNPNQPETERVLASSTDVESLLGSYYKRFHEGPYRTTGSVSMMTGVMSFENYSSLANNCLGARAGIPRAPNDNAIGNVCGTEQLRIYSIESEVVRVASSILATLETTGLEQLSRLLSRIEIIRGVRSVERNAERKRPKSTEPAARRHGAR